MNVRIVLFLSFACVTAVAAQRTWIVDQANGAGTDFTDLPPAVQAAATGDTIFCRPGQYDASVTTSKGLIVLGDGGAPALDGEFLLLRTPRDATFSMKGFRTNTSWRFRASHCEGLVHSHGLFIIATDRKAAMLLEDNRQVTVIDSDLFGSPALDSQASTVTVIESVLTGDDIVLNSTSSPGLVVAGDTHLYTTRVKVFGGKGEDRLGPASPAVFMTANSMTISGDHNTMFVAGTGFASQTRSGIETAAPGGKILIDPLVQVVPDGAAPPISGPVAVTFKELPALYSTVNRQSVVTNHLLARTGDLALLLISTPQYEMNLGSLGRLWLDPLLLIVLDATIVDITQHWVVQTPIPGLNGVPVAFQVFAGPGLDLRLSNPATVILR
jgi:hypothetical protein